MSWVFNFFFYCGGVFFLVLCLLLVWFRLGGQGFFLIILGLLRSWLQNEHVSEDLHWLNFSSYAFLNGYIFCLRLLTWIQYKTGVTSWNSWLYFMVILQQILNTWIETATTPIIATSVLKDLISISSLMSIVTSVKSRGSVKTCC